jgi:hypothetical protein
MTEHVRCKKGEELWREAAHVGMDGCAKGAGQ